MPNSFEKIVELVKKTGDNCIVVDHEGQPKYVIVDFEEYERLVLGRFDLAGLTEDQLLEKINNDVAVWRENQLEENLNNWQSVESIVEGLKKAKADQDVDKNIEDNSLNKVDNESETEEKEEVEEKYYFEPID